MPVRVIIILLLLIGYVGLRRRNGPGLSNRYDLAFLLFAAFYTLRIVIENFAGSAPSAGLYRPPSEILFYFASFIVFPFLMSIHLLLLGCQELTKSY